MDSKYKKFLVALLVGMVSLAAFAVIMNSSFRPFTFMGEVKDLYVSGTGALEGDNVKGVFWVISISLDMAETFHFVKFDGSSNMIKFLGPDGTVANSVPIPESAMKVILANGTTVSVRPRSTLSLEIKPYGQPYWKYPISKSVQFIATPDIYSELVVHSLWDGKDYVIEGDFASLPAPYNTVHYFPTLYSYADWSGTGNIIPTTNFNINATKYDSSGNIVYKTPEQIYQTNNGTNQWVWNAPGTSDTIYVRNLGYLIGSVPLVSQFVGLPDGSLWERPVATSNRTLAKVLNWIVDLTKNYDTDPRDVTSQYYFEKWQNSYTTGCEGIQGAYRYPYVQSDQTNQPKACETVELGTYLHLKRPTTASGIKSPMWNEPVVLQPPYPQFKTSALGDTLTIKEYVTPTGKLTWGQITDYLVYEQGYVPWDKGNLAYSWDFANTDFRAYSTYQSSAQIQLWISSELVDTVVYSPAVGNGQMTGEWQETGSNYMEIADFGTAQLHVTNMGTATTTYTITFVNGGPSTVTIAGTDDTLSPTVNPGQTVLVHLHVSNTGSLEGGPYLITLHLWRFLSPTEEGTPVSLQYKLALPRATLVVRTVGETPPNTADVYVNGNLQTRVGDRVTLKIPLTQQQVNFETIPDYSRSIRLNGVPQSSLPVTVNPAQGLSYEVVCTYTLDTWSVYSNFGSWEDLGIYGTGIFGAKYDSNDERINVTEYHKVKLTVEVYSVLTSSDAVGNLVLKLRRVVANNYGRFEEDVVVVTNESLTLKPTKEIFVEVVFDVRMCEGYFYTIVWEANSLSEDRVEYRPMVFVNSLAGSYELVIMIGALVGIIAVIGVAIYLVNNRRKTGSAVGQV